MAFEKQKSEKNLKAKYLRMWRFKKKFKKWNSILTFLSLLCKFEENLSTKVALVTNGLNIPYTCERKHPWPCSKRQTRLYQSTQRSGLDAVIMRSCWWTWRWVHRKRSLWRWQETGGKQTGTPWGRSWGPKTGLPSCTPWALRTHGTLWNQQLKHLIEKHVPKHMLLTAERPPWMTVALLQQIR